MYDSPSVWYSTSNEGNTNISKDSTGMIDDFVMIAIDDDDYYIIMSKMMSKMDMCYNIINICCYY